MRPLALPILLLVATTTMAQQIDVDSTRWIGISQIRATDTSTPAAGLAVTRNASYQGGPWAGVPALPFHANMPTVDEFRIRSRSL